MLVCFFSSKPDLVEISRIIAENDPHFVFYVRLTTSSKLTSGSVFGHVGITDCFIWVNAWAYQSDCVAPLNQDLYKYLHPVL